MGAVSECRFMVLLARLGVMRFAKFVALPKWGGLS